VDFAVKFFRIAVRFLGATRIDLYELIGLLRSLGYAITVQLPPRGFKTSVGGSGPVATKGDVVVDVNSDRLIVGVASPEPEECINEFIMVERAITSSFDTLKEVHFYELLAELEIKSGDVEPMEFLQRISKGSIITEKISSALGERLFIFGYRLAKEGTSPEDREWIDIEIIPFLIRPHSSLHVSVVYRSRDKEKVLEIGKRLRALVDAISDLMEGVKEGKR